MLPRSTLRWPDGPLFIDQITAPARRRRDHQRRITGDDLREFVRGLGLSDEVEKRFLELTPQTYVGLAPGLVGHLSRDWPGQPCTPSQGKHGVSPRARRAAGSTTHRLVHTVHHEHARVSSARVGFVSTNPGPGPPRPGRSRLHR